MRTLVTGATGFVGRQLLHELEDPIILSRYPDTSAKNLNYPTFTWKPPTSEHQSSSALIPPEAFDGVDTVIHLAGESVGEGRWTGRKRERILRSRQLGTRHLVDSIEQLDSRPSVLVSASAVGYYGDRADDLLDESASPGDGFLVDVCKTWEDEANRARELGVRVITVRIGIVLGPGGGALKKMLLPFKLGLGGRLGHGNQWMPWIHLQDLVRILVFAAQQPSLDGPLNATAPNPVTNRVFTRSMGKALHRPTIFPVPAPMLRLALGEFGGILLHSQRVIPTVLEDLDFSFQFPELDPALQDILGV